MALEARRTSQPPDFLVKLLAMVQDEDPKLIAWSGGKVLIQDPLALEKKLSTYFRHSNFSSFQRQLNNFGFRKIEGKGRLAPCMYMHDELQGLPPNSLLRIRRKTPQTATSNQYAEPPPLPAYVPHPDHHQASSSSSSGTSSSSARGHEDGYYEPDIVKRQRTEAAAALPAAYQREMRQGLAYGGARQSPADGNSIFRGIGVSSHSTTTTSSSKPPPPPPLPPPSSSSSSTGGSTGGGRGSIPTVPSTVSLDSYPARTQQEDERQPLAPMSAADSYESWLLRGLLEPSPQAPSRSLSPSVVAEDARNVDLVKAAQEVLSSDPLVELQPANVQENIPDTASVHSQSQEPPLTAQTEDQPQMKVNIFGKAHKLTLP